MVAEVWREDETVEFKERWSERALEDVAAFANRRGGSLWLGVRDDGTVIGFRAGDQEIQTVANQIVDVLGLRPTLTWRERDGQAVLEIRVMPPTAIVPCKGRFLTRVGSTNREMSVD